MRYVNRVTRSLRVIDCVNAACRSITSSENTPRSGTSQVSLADVDLTGMILGHRDIASIITKACRVCYCVAMSIALHRNFYVVKVDTLKYLRWNLPAVYLGFHRVGVFLAVWQPIAKSPTVAYYCRKTIVYCSNYSNTIEKYVTIV